MQPNIDGYKSVQMQSITINKQLNTIPMKTEVTKSFYDGQKFTELGSYPSLEAAHGEHRHYEHQQTFEDIDNMDSSIPYIHLMEFRDGEHHNDLYFIWKKIN